MFREGSKLTYIDNIEEAKETAYQSIKFLL